MAEEESQNLQEEVGEIRRRVSAAYAFVEGQEAAQAFRALTPEDCFDQYIERVGGQGTRLRPNALDRVAKVKAEIASAIERIKQLPPDAFDDRDRGSDALT